MLVVLLALPLGAAEMPLNMTQGVTDISGRVYDLHMTILYICCAIGLVVFGIMIYSMIYHRKSKGAVAANFHESTKVEIAWTVIPFIILIAMAIPATKTLIAMEDPSNADLTIKVTGSQWKWHYSYFDKDIEFYSTLSTPREQIDGDQTKGVNYLLEVDKPLVLPINQKVRFLMTSDDVIHSWWVPAFAVKKDANPGFINEAWTRIDKPGIYRGQCAELCGKDHGFMPIVVNALSEADFDNWLVEQKQLAETEAAAAAASMSQTLSLEDLSKQGEQVYLARCAACHQPNGAGLPGVFPSLIGSPMIKGPVQGHLDIVINGKPGTAMQAFAKQLSAQDIAAVITYERNAWGNNSGDAVQAADVGNFSSNGAATPNAAAAQANTATTMVDNTADKLAQTANQAVEAVAKAMAPEDLPVLTMEQLMAEGEQVYAATCAACHQATGAGISGAFPSLIGSPVITGPVSGHIEMVMHGKPGTAMQAFSAQLSLQQIAAVITYERNAWGNNTGDTVQAADISNYANNGAATSQPTVAAQVTDTANAVADTVADTVTDAANQAAEAVDKVVTPEASPTLTMEQLMAEGEQVYATTCAACHQATGAGIPGAFPSLIGSPVITGPVSGHIEMVMHGKPGTAMQAFSSQLSPRQMAAVITYERNAWGNNSGDAVQAADVASHGQ
ncbi:cytochrome c oxidase subunit 2 [Shewanella litoralis]|uniref:Cytochrome c oxidase subunit 2 n=1 Tax=Shewanella litoralis TaxID=2282700 RepID=A0ABQ2R0L8_9GAMM|nr:cytochrome c oxidase subunit 2 [Shewanella litoralis]